jgi:hydrogenase expression/formation protein HypE
MRTGVMSEGKILLAHGGGGKLSHDLVSEILLPRFSNPFLEPLDDSARITNQEGPLAFTTDAYVINPLFFPGGDIEEGFSLAVLERIMSSVRDAAEEASIRIVTGDTKVVEHGAADQIFITTAGIGWIRKGVHLSGSHARPGDKVILSGYMGDHEIAVLSQREGFQFQGDLKSDCAPLNGLVRSMLDVCPSIRCLRDPTRGGLATTLNEIASRSKVGITLEEGVIPVRESVRGTCELLGLDPLYLANEGKLIAICPSQEAEKILEAMRAHPLGKHAEIIGRVTEENPKRVILHTLIGGHRVLDMLTGTQYPRIC